MAQQTNPIRISASVGKTPSVNKPDDVLLVQRLLNRAGAGVKEDKKCGPITVATIKDYQRNFHSNPDGRVDPGGLTWKHLVEGKLKVKRVTANPNAGGGPYFLFPTLPISWMDAPRAFGSDRGGTRAHAGCDLYFPRGTWIYAIKDGKVINGPYGFYCETYAIEIDHGDFLARYGEIQAGTLVKIGDCVEAGQKIAKVGHLVGITVPSDMLHLELYDKSATGPLRVEANISKIKADGKPFYRRKDLIDPTPKLNQWKTNLPKAY